MKALFLLLFLSPLLVACAGTPLGNAVNGQRYETHNDIMASWVGSSEEKLISKWGPPKKSYTLSNGNTIIAYESVWGPVSSYHVCSQKFTIQRGIITKWGIDDCKSLNSGDTLPKNTPIPKPTM